MVDDFPNDVGRAAMAVPEPASFLRAQRIA
jgi:hypothetical protein